MGVYGVGPGVVKGKDGRYHQNIAIQKMGGRIKKIKTHHKEGIRCRDAGCKTILSVYNPGGYCNCHEHKEISPVKMSAAKFLKIVSVG